MVDPEAWAVMTIWAEARGESYEGKVAVAEVIRNRTAAKYASNGTVAGTVLRPYQFSCWNTADPNRIAVAGMSRDDAGMWACVQAWREAAAGSQHAGGAVLYYNPAVVRVPPLWVERSTLVVEIGRHRFYTPKERKVEG